jgi:hypothetical protein
MCRRVRTFRRNEQTQQWAVHSDDLRFASDALSESDNGASDASSESAMELSPVSELNAELCRHHVHTRLSLEQGEAGYPTVRRHVSRLVDAFSVDYSLCVLVETSADTPIFSEGPTLPIVLTCAAYTPHPLPSESRASRRSLLSLCDLPDRAIWHLVRQASL